MPYSGAADANAYSNAVANAYSGTFGHANAVSLCPVGPLAVSPVAAAVLRYRDAEPFNYSTGR